MRTAKTAVAFARRDGHHGALRAQPRRARGEWPSTAARTGARSIRRSIRSRATTSSTLQGRVDLAFARSRAAEDAAAVSRDAAARQRPQGHAARRQRRDVHEQRPQSDRAIDPATGATKWLYNPEAYKDGAQADVLGWQSKGVAYWTDGRDDERIFLGTLDGYLIALDARTGQPIRSFGVNGKADLHEGDSARARARRCISSTANSTTSRSIRRRSSCAIR